MTKTKWASPMQRLFWGFSYDPIFRQPCFKHTTHSLSSFIHSPWSFQSVASQPFSTLASLTLLPQFHLSLLKLICNHSVKVITGDNRDRCYHEKHAHAKGQVCKWTNWRDRWDGILEWELAFKHLWKNRCWQLRELTCAAGEQLDDKGSVKSAILWKMIRQRERGRERERDREKERQREMGGWVKSS